MSSPTPPSKNGKELPNEVRMLLAFVLMGIILVATPWVYKRLGIVTPQPAAPMNVRRRSPHQRAKPPPRGPYRSAAALSPAAAAERTAVAESSESEWTSIHLYHVIFSNRGAVVKSWTLKNFKDSDNKPLELVNQKARRKVGFPFTYDFRGQQPTSDLNKALWVAHPAGDGLSIEYSIRTARPRANKNFTFQRDGYMVQYRRQVEARRRRSSASGSVARRLRGHGGQQRRRPSAERSLRLRKGSKLISEAAKSAKNGPVRADGIVLFRRHRRSVLHRFVSSAAEHSARRRLPSTTSCRRR